MIITPKELREQAATNMQSRIQVFNEKVSERVKDCPESPYIYLDFEDWGYNHEDIQFVIDAGYDAYRCSACLWWEVRWD